MVIPPGAAKSELLYPEIFQRCSNLERDDKRRVRRKVWQSARSHRFKSSRNRQFESTEVSGLGYERCWRQAQQQDTSCCSHSFASFWDFQKYPSVEGGKRRVGAHQRRGGQVAKPGRGERDTVSRRSSPGILLSLRAERALSSGAGIEYTEFSAPLPHVDFKIKRAFRQTQEEVFFFFFKDMSL